MSLVEWLIANLAMGIGAVVQGGVGFGGNLIAVPVLVVLDPELVPAPALIGSMALNILMVWRERGASDWSRLAPSLAGRIPGSFVAALVLTQVPDDRLRLFFAALILISVALSASGLHISPSKPNLFVGGTASGFMATSIGIGGPPMAIVLQQSEGPVVRRTLAKFFLVGVLIAYTALIAFGEMGLTEVARGLALVPGTVIGFALSRPVAHFLDQGYTRPAVLTVSAAAAIVAIVQAVS